MSSPRTQDNLYGDIDALERRIELLEKRNANVSSGSSGGTLSAGSVMDVHVNSAAAIQLSKLAVDPRARATHTGTQLAATISDFGSSVTAYRIDQFAAPTVAWSNNNQRIASVANPTSAQDAATKSYVDTTSTSDRARANHTGTQVASTIANFDTQVRSSRLDQMAAPTAAVSLNNQKLTTVATPTSAADAATKGYVDTRVPLGVNGQYAAYDVNGNLVSAVPVVAGVGAPVGTIHMWPAAAAPTGFLICDGSAVSRTTYPDLFAAIGTTYGAGDGATTFNLPNFKGRYALGAGTGVGGGTSGTGAVAGGSGLTARTIGQWGGEETHTLSIAEMPSHGHAASVSDPGHNHGAPLALAASTGHGAGTYSSWVAGTDGWAGAGANNGSYIPTGTTGITVNNSSTGGGAAHNVVSPFLVVNFIIQSIKNPGGGAPTTKFAAAIGDGAALTYNVAHNLGTTDVVVSFRDGTGQRVDAGWKAVDNNTVQATFSVAPAVNAVRIVVIA